MVAINVGGKLAGSFGQPLFIGLKRPTHLGVVSAADWSRPRLVALRIAGRLRFNGWFIIIGWLMSWVGFLVAETSGFKIPRFPALL